MPEPLVGSVEQPQAERTDVVSERQAFESAETSKEDFLERPEPREEAASTVVESVPAAAPVVVPIPVAKDEVTVEVERVLEEGLGSFYASLPAQAKPLFRRKGEVAASEIAAMVRKLDLRLKRALQLVRDWLLTVPGVNKFFLEQEAKIKVDRLKDLVEAKKNEASRRV